MRKSYKLLKFLTFLIFVLFIFTSFPKPAHAALLGDIFSSPESFIVRVREKIEYFLAFKTEQKIIILEKQAERRLKQAENLVITKDVNQALSLIKNYQTLKETQGNLIESIPTTDLTGVKEQTVKQQARIEAMKKGMQDDARETVEESQRTVIKTMVDNIKTEEGEEKVTEFAEEVKNVLDTESNIFAPGTNEVAPGTLEVAPGTQDIKP